MVELQPVRDAGLPALAAGLAFGLSLAMPPGPVNALIAREASRFGWLAGVRAGLAAPLLDTVYLAIVLLGVAYVPEEGLRWLTVAGAGLLAYLAVKTVQPPAARANLAGLGSVVLVTLTNPFQYAWWASSGAAFAAAVGPWGIAGFLLAIFGWVFAFSHLVGRGAAKWEWFEPMVAIVSADVLVVFAAWLAVQAGL